jgi:serine/threonine-protein kinase
MARSDGSVDPTLTPQEAGVATAPDTLIERPRPTATPLAIAGYEVGATIGRGGMGEVVAARDPRIGREVAIKTLRAGAASSELVDRFLREAKIQGRLDHPAIVPVHEIGHDANGQPYFTMKRLNGETLAEVLVHGAPLQRLLRAFVDACLAIQFAHDLRIVHRDLKPSNIMLGRYGEVYVLDWGIARAIGDASAPGAAHDIATLDGQTQAGALLGTPGYMAPEQVDGAAEAREPADAYALGCILFEILAGEPLHPSGRAGLATTLATPTDSPARRAPARAIAPELDAACTAALAQDPAARPTARDLADRVQRYLDGDRDLEQRRTLAAELAEKARDDLASANPGRQRDGARDAGRALALDPSSTAAAALVAKVMFEPSQDDPPEVVAALDDEERRLDRERSGRLAGVFLAFALWLPCLLVQHVASWTNVALLCAAPLWMVAIARTNAGGRYVPLPVRMVGCLGLVLAFSRLGGAFIVTPIVVCGAAITLATHRRMSRAPWRILLWTAVAMMLPFALEALGVFAPTWRMTPQGLLVWGTVVDHYGRVDAAITVVGNLAIVLVPTLLASVIVRGRDDALRELHRREWRLRRLLPTMEG